MFAWLHRDVRFFQLQFSRTFKSQIFEWCFFFFVSSPMTSEQTSFKKHDVERVDYTMFFKNDCLD